MWGWPHVRLEFSEFEWDPEVKGFKTPDELFGLTPPEGFKLDDQTEKPEETP